MFKMTTTENAQNKLKIGSGLRNLGNSCFFNATIQALFHVPILTNLFRKDSTIKCQCIICAVQNLFEKTKCSKFPCDPSMLYEQLKNTSIPFSKLLNGKQQDAHEFQKVFNRVMTNEKHPNFTYEEKFTADIEYEIECSLCKTVYYNSGIAEFIVNIRGKHSVKVALQSYFDSDVIDDYACVVCMKNVLAKKKTTLLSTPECLCITLNRFENRYSKLIRNIEIDQELVLKCISATKDREFKYRLASVVSHIGKSLSSGHYITIVNSENTLHEFNDCSVNEVTAISGRDAYILFYERIEECGIQDPEELIPIEIIDEFECMDSSNECTMNDNVNKSGVYIKNEVITRNKDVSAENANVWTMNDVMNKDGVYIENEVIMIEEDWNQCLNEQSERLIPIEIIDEDEYIENECLMNDILEEYRECIENKVTFNGGNSLQDLNEDLEGFIPFEFLEEKDSNGIHNLTEGDVENEIIENDVKKNIRGSSITPNEGEFSSRRIVDVEHVFRQMEGSFKITCKCCGGDMTFTNETKRGLISTFHFTCTSCDKKKKIDSCPKSRNQANNNEAAVLGVVSIGLGFYHLQEFLAHFNIPCMSYQTFYNIDKILQADWWKLSKKLQAEALTEEIRLAKENNQVDSAGNALIGVKGDGCWATRSYGSNYTSLAGCASLIGIRTNKVVYSDVKSKYCHICKIAQAKNSPPNKHECNANYTGPSTGMETAIIVDGFKYCAEQGARFDKFVGDGDSSTYKKIRDLRLYQNPNVYTMKFGCNNHIHKNFLKKCYSLVERPKFKGTRNTDIISRRIGEDISKGIRMAAKHWNECDVDLGEKCRGLAKDCMNAPLHCLGIHEKCSEYFCTKTTSPAAEQNVALLKNNGFYYELLRLCQHYFANNALSLLAGYDTNVVEGFNSLVAKYLAGKRVQNALAGSYKSRTAMAVVHLNSGYHGGSTFLQFKYGKVLPGVLNMENKRKRKVENNTIQEANKPKKRKVDDNQSGKKKKTRYGEGKEDMDMDPDEFEVAKNILLEQLNEDRMNRHSIQIETREQIYSWRYAEVKRNLLTSSYFGRILHVRSRTSYKKIVEDILYHNIQYSNAAELTHQRLYEIEALDIFCDRHKDELIDICGIFIDEKFCFLGASPFRLFGRDGIVVIKCPYKAFKKTINDAIEKKLIPFWKKEKGSDVITVDYTNHWHFEIQGQLHIADKKFAHLMVYLGPNEFKFVTIERDKNFWKEKMEAELVYFFNEAMLKELVDPRDGRGMELREYDKETDTFI